MTQTPFPREMRRHVAGFLLDFNHLNQCEEPHLVDHVILSWFDPEYEHPELLGLYHPRKVVIKHKEPTTVDAARRGNMPLMQALRRIADGMSKFRLDVGLQIVNVPTDKTMEAAVAFGHVDHVKWLIGCGGTLLGYYWIMGGRFNKAMFEWILEQKGPPSVSTVITCGNLPLAKKLMSEGHALGVREEEVYYYAGGLAYGKTDVLDWLVANYQYTPQQILEEIVKVDEYDNENPYTGCYSKVGLDWLLANGAVLRERYFMLLFEECELYHEMDDVLEGLQSKRTTGSAVYLLQWLYENGCPISEQYKDLYLLKMLEKYCKRPK